MKNVVFAGIASALMFTATAAGATDVVIGQPNAWERYKAADLTGTCVKTGFSSDYCVVKGAGGYYMRVYTIGGNDSGATRAMTLTRRLNAAVGAHPINYCIGGAPEKDITMSALPLSVECPKPR